MSDLQEDLDGLRRMEILRLLVKIDGHASERVIYTAMQHRVFPAPTPDDIRKDLYLLKTRDCTTEEWLDDEVRAVSLTERGAMAARGRVRVAGVKFEIWDN